MKKERMSILNMLEKGIITAQEAERLLLALNGTAKTPEREGVNDVVNQALNKAGSAINTFAKAVGQQAEKLEPKVKNVAEKQSHHNTADKRCQGGYKNNLIFREQQFIYRHDVQQTEHDNMCAENN